MNVVLCSIILTHYFFNDAFGVANLDDAFLEDLDEEYENIWNPLGKKRDSHVVVPEHYPSNSDVERRQEELDLSQLKKDSGCTHIPFFKHLLVHLMQLTYQQGDGQNGNYLFQGALTANEYDVLKKALADESSSSKLVLDLFSAVKPHHGIRGICTSQTSWAAVIACVCGVISVLMLLLLFLQRILYQGISTWKHVVWMLFFAFIISIPWEWYRMYKGAVADRVVKVMNGIPKDCNPGNLTPWESLRMWWGKSFSLEDDACMEYHKMMLVDPLWEVSPFQAASVCVARLFTEPSRQFASALGSSMRLFLKELPAQWQPIALILGLVFVLVSLVIFSGFEIYTPLLRIGVRQNAALLAEKDNQIRQLQLQLHRDKEITLQAVLHETAKQKQPQSIQLQPQSIQLQQQQPQSIQQQQQQQPLQLQQQQLQPEKKRSCRRRRTYNSDSDEIDDVESLPALFETQCSTKKRRNRLTASAPVSPTELHETTDRGAPADVIESIEFGSFGTTVGVRTVASSLEPRSVAIEHDDNSRTFNGIYGAEYYGKVPIETSDAVEIISEASNRNGNMNSEINNRDNESSTRGYVVVRRDVFS